MTASYDKYYQQANYFGDPVAELLTFFSEQPRGPLLDLGCGQGRNALPLARMGFLVTGVDTSEEGVSQMLICAEKEKLIIQGLVQDIYGFSGFEQFQYILLDSMFHFYQKDKERETSLIYRILEKMKSGAQLVVCILDQGEKVNILKATIEDSRQAKQITEKPASYHFVDSESNTSSAMPYKLVIAEVA